MNERITLRQLTEMFNSLPDSVLDKKLAYLDLSYINEKDLEEFKQRLIGDENREIEMCCN